MALRRNSKIERQDLPGEEAVKAQNSVREAAGLGPELFPVQAFVRLISDEIQLLREEGKTDDEIASIIRSNSAIEISAAAIQENYASSQERHRPGE